MVLLRFFKRIGVKVLQSVDQALELSWSAFSYVTERYDIEADRREDPEGLQHDIEEAALVVRVLNCKLVSEIRSLLNLMISFELRVVLLV